MSIRHLTYQHIDKQKWDACITTAGNGLVYAQSVYLDTLASHWDALVLNDYEAVMPLTWNKKYGIHYLYQPFFTACLGVFGNNITADLLNDFLQQIPLKFRYWDIYLNHGNLFQLPNFKLYERINYVLPLHDSYEKLFDTFRDNIKRNIKKAEKLQCTINKNFPVDDVISLAMEQAKVFSLPKTGYDNFKKLYEFLYLQQQAITYGVFNAAGQLVSSCVFFFFKNRAYYILVGNHPDGKTIGSSHLLIATFIRDYAGQNLVLDFEGSDIRNLAFFYSSFGAVEEKYAGIKLNRLPKILQLIKK